MGWRKMKYKIEFVGGVKDERIDRLVEEQQ